MAATSLPASGSLIPIDHDEVPAMMSGRKRACWSSVPNCMSVGPIWRSANHDVATGAPVEMRDSNTTKRSNGLRPPPPTEVGQVMPNQPRRASSKENGRDVPTIHESSRTARETATSCPSASASRLNASNSGPNR